MPLWCYACEQRAATMTPTANNIFQIRGQNPYVGTLGDTGDISNLCQFGWYEWVYFHQKPDAFPFQKEELGICLGTTKNYGNYMCQWVLQNNGKVVPRRALRRLRLEELTITNKIESNKRAAFDSNIKESFGDYISPAPFKPSRELFKNCSSPRCPVRSHSLVCSKIYFQIAGIVPIHVK